MQNPELLKMAQDPELMRKLQDVQSNPGNFFKYSSDPKFSKFVDAMRKIMG